MKVNPDPRLVVIGIQGAMGSGKSTIRKFLQERYGARWVPMSGALKRALVAMGADEADIYDPARKELENPLFCGKTNRYALQTIGTEWGRELMGPDIWVNCAKKEVLDQLSDPDETYHPNGPDEPGVVIVVFDDIRFPNEYQMVRDFGGVIWTVRRSEVEYSLATQEVLRTDWKNGIDVTATAFSYPVHESERWWAVAPADRMFYNGEGMDIPGLQARVADEMTKVLQQHGEKHRPS